MTKILSYIKRSKLCTSAVSCLLALSVILSTFAGMSILAGNTNEVWSGEVASGFAGGAGTAKDPYKITNGEELALAVSQNKGYYYEMSNDIYLNDVSASDWKNKVNKEWAVKILNGEASAFKGVFNGNGYKVFGLYVNKTYTAPTDTNPDLAVSAGLFPAVAAGAEIYGVGLENSYINLRNDHATADMSYVGYAGLIGYAYNGSSAKIIIDRCYVGSDVTLNAAYIGLVASAKATSTKSVIVTNCYITAQGTAFNGGTISNNRLMLCSGRNHSPFTIDYTYSVSNLTNSGGETSSETKYNYGGAWCSSYVGTKVTPANMKGEAAFTNMPGLNTEGAFEVNANGYPTLKIFNKKAGDVWDGRTLSAPTEGDGSEASPYIISTPYELAYIIKYPVSGANYKLAADIYLNDTEKIDWATGEGIDGYVPNSWFNYTDVSGGFSATLDGDGYMVYGLYYNDSTTTKAWQAYGVGLFPIITTDQSTTVRNLGIDKAFLEGPYAVGAIFGGITRSTATNISNSFVGEEVTLKGHDAGAFIGVNARGGYNIENCYSLANVTATANSGLMGDFYSNLAGSYLRNCYNAKGPITTKSTPSGSANNYATEKTGTGIAVISNEAMKGLDALTNESKMPKLGSSFLATTGYPMLLAFYEGELPDGYYAWDGASKEAPTEGSGTAADPFIIDTGAKLAFAVTTSESGKYYKLTKDIYLNNIDKIDWTTGLPTEGYTPNEWFATGTFSGHLDGDGHTVYGLYYNDPETKKAWSMAGSALIPVMGEGASLKNIAVDKAYVDHPNGAAALVAAASGVKYSINSCYVGEDVTLCGYSTGALVAVTSGIFKISNSYSFATTLRGVETDAGSTYGLFGDMYSKPGTQNLSESVLANVYNANGPISTKNEQAGTTTAVYVTEGKKGIVRTADNMQGLDVFALDSKMPDLNKGRAFYATNTYPVLKVFAEEATGPISEDIWSGAVATTFPMGDGSEQDPYVITNGAELALAVSQEAGYYYQLANDIYLNDVSVPDWEKSVNNIEWLDNQAFKGHIDGKGYIVYGIWYAPDTAKTTTGLVSYFNGGSIKNIGVRYAQIYAEKYAGLVGSINGARSQDDRMISGAFADDTVTVGYTTNSNCGAGGIVGIIDSVTDGTKVKVAIENCYSKATITGPSAERLNGIVGTTWKSNYTVKNCYSVGYAPYYGKNDNVISRLIVNGAEPSEVYSGVYATAGTPTEQENYTIFDRGTAYGSAAKTVLPALDFDTIWDTAATGTPKLKIFTSISGDDKNPVDSGPYWNGTIATEFESGSGSETDPYIITKGSQLALAVSQSAGYYYKLAKDIYLNNTNLKNWQNAEGLNEWVTTTGFNGHLDGDGHIVNGIWFPRDTTAVNAGLVSQMKGGSIKNIGVRNSVIYARNHAGGIVGNMTVRDYTKKAIESCFVDETVSVEYTVAGNYGAGGIVGMMNSLIDRETPVITIKNCYSKARITASSNDRANGIIGSNWKSAYIIENCYSVGKPPYYAGSEGTLSSLAIADDGTAGTMTYAEVYKNIYATNGSPKEQENYTVITDQESLWGSGGKTQFKGFDFQNVWATVKNGTPKLKIFADLLGEDIEFGTEDSRYASGIGTKKDPYIIKTEQQLRNLVTATDTTGKFYKLANDIYINDVSKSNWMLNSPDLWYEDSSVSFKGTFDGCGHFIYGLYLNKTPADSFSYTGAGLFPTATDAVIKNVHIRKSYISGTSSVGSIIGTHYGGTTILACSADETVTLKGFAVGGLVGGGGGVGLKLHYSYFTGTAEGSAGRSNGLVGDIWKTDHEVVECYTIGYTGYRSGYFPALYYGIYGTVAQNTTKVLTEAQMTGAAAKTYMTDFNWDNWTVKSGETPHPKVIDKTSFSFVDEGKKGRAWSGKQASKFAGGSGTEEDPYLIETPEQLALLMRTTSTNGKFYKLIADIKINDTSKANWTEDAMTWFTHNTNFRGSFDGDGHVVSGLFYDLVDAPYVGLFPTISYNSTIKRVGVINSSIVNVREKASNFAAAIVGSVQAFGDAEIASYPTISQCFVDDSVYIECGHAGGLVGGSPETVYIDNCYVTCELTGTTLAAAAIGTAWKADKPSYVTNSYFATQGGDPVIENNAGNTSVFKGSYNDGKKGRCAINLLNLRFMQGANAKQYMPELDYENVWMTVEGGSPVLRCFRNAAQYSCTREPKKTEMSFASNEGSECAPLYGYAGDTIDHSILPVPERYGYKFLGWYTSKNLTLPVEENIFVWPTNDFIVHAKWEQTGYEQGFDNNLDEKFDYNKGVEHYKPGAKGYNPKNIEGGLKSMHTLPDAVVDPIFLVNYERPMEKGKVYDVNFWIKLEDGAEGTLDFIHADYPQHNSPTTAGYQAIIELASVKTGEWVQYKATVTANAPYLLVRLPAGTEMYLDSFHIVPTDEEGELGDLSGFDPSDIATEPDNDAKDNNNLLFIILGIAGGVLLLAAIATVVIIFVKKGKKAKA